jgi:hypothetical protein
MTPKPGGTMSPIPGDTMTPMPGDVLVSNPTATVEYDVSIVGGPMESAGAHYTTAVALAKTLAAERRVDAWLTEDHTHFLQIAFCRDTIDERV